ncbi:MAG: protoporphyrinogen oxidase [Candidatus Poriferisodalaceae bacterium]|jgi:protoporphyrinogen oxidase
MSGPAERVDVVVVGGGPCGLTAALEASRRGLSVQLVEAAPTLGGMAASFTVAGQRVDYGSHRLHPSMAPRVRELLVELLGDDLQVRERNGRLRLRDRWVAFPLQPADLARSLPASFIVSSARDAMTAPFRRATNDSYAEVVRTGLGPTALADFHGPMAHKLWGVPASELSGYLARKRLSVRTPTSLIRTIAKATRPSGRTFLYPRLGYGQIVEQLAEAATSSGAQLLTSTSVVRLTTGSGGPTVELDSGSVLAAKRVLWTGSPSSLATALGQKAPELAPARGMVLAYLVVATERYTGHDAHYVPDLDVAFSRLSEPRNYRDGPDPDGQTVLCAEIPCSPGDDTWRCADDAIESMVIDGLGRLDLPTPAVRGIEVRRLPSVYPIATVDDPGAPKRALHETDDLEGVTVLGRQGLLVADNLHHVIDMAQSAIDCFDASGAWSSPEWSRQRLRFDGFVVED